MVRLCFPYAVFLTLRYVDYFLADASITQSALEEAYLSNVQNGRTIGSTINNLKSRYLPK